MNPCAAAAEHVAAYCGRDTWGVPEAIEPGPGFGPESQFHFDRVHNDDSRYHTTIGEVGVITPRISIDRMNELDAQVERLDEAVRSEFGVPPKPNPDHPLGIWPFLQDWDIFIARWKVWRVEHEGELSRIGDEPVSEFVAFKSEFNRLLERSRDEHGIDSSAQPVAEGHATPGGGTLFAGIAGLVGLAALAFGIGYLLRGAAAARSAT